MKIEQVLKQQIEIIKPSSETINEINKTTKDFVEYLNKKLKKKKIKADVFVGGSLAKGTLIKKDKYDPENKFSDSQTFPENVYDVDIFVRFNEKYGDEKISSILGQVLGKKAKKIHGSRDYYQIIINGIIMEIIPVIKIKKPNEAKNVMDLSYFHVKYVLGKIKKNKKLADEIILAKSFCHAQNCYGAESYIRGFSGYALELLIIHYKSFENFLKQVIKQDKSQIIIDDSKFYKKQNVLIELNESKLNSPIILIDPTYKQRNALAGLSEETFNKFKKIGKSFLKRPSLESFKEKNIGTELIKKYKNKLNIVCVKTNKQVGDIAGTKSRKFLNFLVFKLKKEFTINLSEFDYNEKKNVAYFYFILGKKSDELIRGPFVDDKNNLKKFKQAHKKTVIKGKSAYAKLKHNLSFKEWFKLFSKKERKIIREMSVKKIGLFKCLIKHKCKC
jgi:tRNA nucleotidyltransferase (CCA-adding enzyme)